jgi:hypothetical protein
MTIDLSMRNRVAGNDGNPASIEMPILLQIYFSK